MKDLFEEPGIYEYDAVAVHVRVAPLRLTQPRVRIVTNSPVHNALGTFDVYVREDGTLELRSVEGRLVVEPKGSNEIILRIEEWQ